MREKVTSYKGTNEFFFGSKDLTNIVKINILHLRGIIYLVVQIVLKRTNTQNNTKH